MYDARTAGTERSGRAERVRRFLTGGLSTWAGSDGGPGGPPDRQPSGMTSLSRFSARRKAIRAASGDDNRSINANCP